MKKVLLLLITVVSLAKIYSQDLIIENINIIPMTSDTVLSNKNVLIKNGKIVAIDGHKIKRRNNIKVINGKGKYLLPGLADMHVHLPEEQKIEKLLLANIAAGVTQIRIMNSVVPQTELREKLSQNPKLISPNIHFSHIIDRKDKFSSQRADSLMQALTKDHISFIKLVSLSNEETFNNLTKAAQENNITICGHYPVYQKDGKAVAVEMEKVLKSHYKSIEHLGGYTSITEEKKFADAIKLTKEKSIYNCPTLDWDIMAYNLQYPADYKKRLTYQLLPSSITKDWENNYSSTIAKIGGNEIAIANKNKYETKYDLKLKTLKKLYENNCLLLVGSDPSLDFQANGFNIYEEMINWTAAGIDNFTILKSATITPAKFFNEQSCWGTVEVGKNAELLILAKNPLDDIRNISTVETTIVNKKIYNNTELINQL